MKYLSNYIEAKQTELFNKTGSFFAFSDKQFDEQMKKGVKYASLGAGMICPRENIKALREGLDSIHKEGIAQDLKENGKEAIIKRELYNHECFYTMDYLGCKDALEGYEITDQELKEGYNKEFDMAMELN